MNTTASARDRADVLARDLLDLAELGRRTPPAERDALRRQYRSARAELRAIQAELPPCRTCGELAGQCSLQCPDSPGYYSPEAERDDAAWQDGLSHDAWLSLAARQYEAVHGEPWCS